MMRTTSIQIRDFSARRCNERGFALLEILVAFIILAVGLGAISTGVAVAMRSDGRAQTSRVAFHLAQSRLEAAGVTEALTSGHREGRIADNYKWRETITAVHIGAEPTESRDGKPAQTVASAGITSFWVEIAVQAADGTVARLAVLKLGPETRR